MRSRSLLPVTPKELRSVLPELIPPVTSDVVPVTSEVIASDQSHTYKYNKNYKYDKRKKPRFEVNVERWSVISSKLDPYVVKKWVHTPESEHLLAVILERPGMTVTVLRDLLGALNFSTSDSNTGLLMNFLRIEAGAKGANKSHHKMFFRNRTVTRITTITSPPASRQERHTDVTIVTARTSRRRRHNHH